MEEVHMIKKKPANPHTAIEVKNATLAWDFSHASVQSSPKLTPKMKKDKKVTKSKKEKMKLQNEGQQAVLAEQRGHLLVDSDDHHSPEEEHKIIHLVNLRLQRTLYNIDLEIEKVRRNERRKSELLKGLLLAASWNRELCAVSFCMKWSILLLCTPVISMATAVSRMQCLILL